MPRLDNVYVFDPTASDDLSRVRGVGRYVQILKENFPDFIFTNNVKEIPEDATFINPFFNFLQPPLLTRHISRTQVAVIHDIIPLLFPQHFPTGIKGKINIFLNKLALKKYDFIITDSQSSKDEISKKLKILASKIHVVYPSLPRVFLPVGKTSHSLEEKSAIMRKYGITDTGIWNYFIYVGDVTWNKNLVTIAKAIKKAHIPCIFVGKAFSNFKFQISNSKTDPWLKEFRNFTKETEHDRRFFFPGFVPDEDLALLYKYATANILVSHDEGFGFSYHEAALQKTPSILSNIPVFQELAKDSALYVNPDSIDHLAEAIKSLIESEQKREQYSTLAFNHAKIFSSAEFKRRILALL